MNERERDLTSSLRRIRRCRRSFWMLHGVWLAGGIALVSVASAATAGVGLFIWSIGWGWAIRYADIFMQHLVCPQCGRPFFCRDTTAFGFAVQEHRYWARRCTNCGLEI